MYLSASVVAYNEGRVLVFVFSWPCWSHDNTPEYLIMILWVYMICLTTIHLGELQLQVILFFTY